MINLRNIFVKTNIVLVFCLIWNHSSLAQSLFDTTYIDTIALKVKRDFDAQDFIRMTKEDTSFHRAFKNLKMYKIDSMGGKNRSKFDHELTLTVVTQGSTKKLGPIGSAVYIVYCKRTIGHRQAKYIYYLIQ